MKVLYKNPRFWVVNDGCPGLSIHDVLLNRPPTFRTGHFYDNMGPPYHPDALTAAREVADRLFAEDELKSAEYRRKRDQKGEVMGKLKVDLSGPDGNVFAVIALAKRLFKQKGEDGKAVVDEMLAAPNYQTVLDLFEKHHGDVAELIR